MIGLATGHRVYNYGTRLQAYAMQNIMRSRGFDCEIIRYVKTGKSGLKAGLKKGFAASPLFGIYAREKAIHQQLRKSPGAPAGLKKDLRTRFRAFDDFNKTHLNIRQVCGSFTQLTEHFGAYSAVFCGSDQAWLPDNIRHRLYTLEFCPEGVRRISYAPSFGVSQVPEEMKETYTRFLNRMDHISVRELRGQELVAELSGREVPVVLDPTLLLEADFWNSQAKKMEIPGEKGYIFCYFLGNNSQHRQMVKNLKEKTGLTVVSIAHMKTYVREDSEVSDVALYDVSPLDFLGLIRDARYVCTDSFHGTAFSIQFQKDFFAFPRHADGDAGSTNSRLYSILQLLGAQERMIRGNQTLPLEPMEYAAIDEKLIQMRKTSNAYLDEALKGLR